MILRSYQQRARSEARKAYAAGSRAILYVAPTGAGKTVILGDTIVSHLRHTPDARVNVYAHRGELIDQAARTFRAFGLDVGVSGLSPSAPVQVGTVQSTLARGAVERCTMGVFDEAHHYAADLWGDVAKAIKAMGATVVGATATPERGDGRPLDHMFDSLVVVAQVSELVALWHADPTQGLVPCRVVRPVRPLRSGQIAESPAKAYRRLAPGRSAVVRRFAIGEIPVLVNVNVLTEGWDAPICECVIIARGMGSVGMLIQAAGRGARPHPGKSGYLVIDLRGVTSELGRPDEDREYSLDGVGISCGRGVVAEVRLCRLCKQAIPEGEEWCPFRSEAYPRGHFCGLRMDTIANVALEEWSLQKHMSKDDEATRVARLAGWIRGAEARGLRGRALYSLRYKFKGTYGAAPDNMTWSAAVAHNRSMGWQK